MKKLAALAALVLAACAGGPPPPAWQGVAHGALETYTDAYLAGNQRVADLEFARARDALARTGRAELVARAELTRCAVQAASLAFDDCPGFTPLAADAPAAERAYADFLAGRPTDPALLPPAYRGIAGSPASGLAGIAEPLPRLIAAGVLFRQGRLDPAGIAQAMDTASAQGWRRPLLAWLGVEAKRAEAAGDQAAAARIRRRIDLVSGGR